MSGDIFMYLNEESKSSEDKKVPWRKECEEMFRFEWRKEGATNQFTEQLLEVVLSV